MTSNANILSRIRDWLRAGYPEGLPEQDYVVLLGLLARRLTPAEVDEVAHRLVASGDLHIAEDHIADMITRVTKEPPLDNDVLRVAAHLAAGGWPLSGFDDDDPQALLRSAS